MTTPTIGVHMTDDHAVMVRLVGDTGFAIIPDERGRRIIPLDPASSRRERFARLLELARAVCGFTEEDHPGAIFTVPAAWGDEERFAWFQDAKEAGWDSRRLLNDSTALFLATVDAASEGVHIHVVSVGYDAHLALNLVAKWEPDETEILAQQHCTYEPSSIARARSDLLRDPLLEGFGFDGHLESWVHGGRTLSDSAHDTLRSCLDMESLLDVHPIEGFALGAARRARALGREVITFSTSQRVAHSLGVDAGGRGPDWLIPHGEITPWRVTERYAIARDAPSTVVRIVSEEPHEQAPNAWTLGAVDVSEWFDEGEEWCEVAVTLFLTDPAHLEVTCVHEGTGKTRRSTYDLT